MREKCILVAMWNKSLIDMVLYNITFKGIEYNAGNSWTHVCCEQKLMFGCVFSLDMFYIWP
jgi:hypothetical protein